MPLACIDNPADCRCDRAELDLMPNLHAIRESRTRDYQVGSDQVLDSRLLLLQRHLIGLGGVVVVDAARAHFSATVSSSTSGNILLKSWRETCGVLHDREKDYEVARARDSRLSVFKSSMGCLGIFRVLRPS